MKAITLRSRKQLEARAEESPSAPNARAANQEDPNLNEDTSKKNERKLAEDVPKSPIPKGLEYKPVVQYSFRLKQDKEDA